MWHELRQPAYVPPNLSQTRLKPHWYVPETGQILFYLLFFLCFVTGSNPGPHGSSEIPEGSANSLGEPESESLHHCKATTKQTKHCRNGKGLLAGETWQNAGKGKERKGEHKRQRSKERARKRDQETEQVKERSTVTVNLCLLLTHVKANRNWEKSVLGLIIIWQV